MQKQIEEILQTASGTFGVAIKHLQTGEEVVVNGQRLFQLASVFKLPILAALFNEVEKGRLALSDRIELTLKDRVPGSGVLKELDAGTNISVKDLAMLMIIISDNSATDKLLQLIGKETVQSFMKELGLEKIFVCHSCWELLALSVGKQPVPYSEEAYDEITSLLDQGKFDGDSLVFQESEQNNVATVTDLNQLLEKILLRQGVSEFSANGILEILLKQQLNQRIPFLLPSFAKVAHKTGTVGGTVNDSGIIYLPNDRGELLISALSGGNASVHEGAHTIAKIAEAAYSHFATEKSINS